LIVQILPTIMQFSLASARWCPVTPFVCPSNRNGGKRALLFLLEHAQANHPGLWRNILNTTRTFTDTASEPGKEARESVEELGRSAGKKLDQAREDTGDALRAAASSVRSTGRKSSEAIDNLATGAADRLDATASFVEDHDLRDVFTGLQKFGRRHLTGCLVAAAAVGFLAGSAISRATHSCSCGRAPEST
jgi:ABC-type transporter Mla subunit MlaD